MEAEWTREQWDRFGYWKLRNWLPWLKQQHTPKHQEWAKTVEESIRYLEEKYPDFKRLIQ